MEGNRHGINQFLVEIFNRILRQEEKALSAYGGGKISVKEFHLIEAVVQGMENHQNTMGEISKQMGITMGTLSTAAATMERKGFLQRVKSKEDKRMVRLVPTEKGQDANDYHSLFHEKMVDAITKDLTDQQLGDVVRLLEILREHFTTPLKVE